MNTNQYDDDEIKAVIGRFALPHTARLMGASKQQSAQKISRYIENGLHLFGENRVQEAQEKWPELKKCYPFVQLHFIGALQTNKAREAVELFDTIETLDRPSLVDALAEMERKTNIKRNYYISVNIGEESQKSGVLPEQLPALLDYAQKKQLHVNGLMCVPPQGHPPAGYFALMQKLAIRHNLPQLSMGMSEDYATALRFGSTHIRIGTALFGQRPEAH